MAKKLKKGLNEKKSSIIVTGPFSIDNAKMYIAATLIMFHIIPLLFVFWGEVGRQLLLTTFMFMLNPLFIFCVNMFHAVRMGFSWKFVLIVAFLAALSIFMYYEVAEGMIAQTVALCFIVYFIFAMVSEALGGFLKRLLGGY
jgi:hypothetical protein